MDDAAAERDVRRYLLQELIRDEELDLDRDEAIFSSGRLPAKRRKALATSPAYRAAATALTFFCVTLLWVFFPLSAP